MNDKKVNRIKHGQGRVEYLANKDKIQELLGQGYTLTSIYEDFKSAEKITMSYKRLVELVSQDKTNTKKLEEPKKKYVPPVAVGTPVGAQKTTILKPEKDGGFRQVSLNMNEELEGD